MTKRNTGVISFKKYLNIYFFPQRNLLITDFLHEQSQINMALRI